MKSKMTITATGDALMVKRLPKGYEGFEPVANFIKQGQARLTNLEVVLSDFDCFPSSYSGGTWVNATPDILPELLSYGFNGCGCANNHSMDYSYDGLLSTMKILKKADIAFAGIGRNLHEAAKPAVLDLPQGRLGMISICSTFEDAARAGTQGEVLPGRPGLNPLRMKTEYIVTKEHMTALKEIAANTKINGEKDNAVAAGFGQKDALGMFSFGNLVFREGEKEVKVTKCHEGDLNRTKKTIQEALSYMDYVVVMAHSHQIKGNYYYEPDYFFEDFCRACIDAGASAVIGSGTHQLKPVEIYKEKPIFYSLGNFIFQNGSVSILPPDFMEKYNLSSFASTAEALCARSQNGKVGLHTDNANYRSVIPYIELEGEQVTKVVLKPIELGFDLSNTWKGLPFEANPQVTMEIFEHLQEISKGYGTQMKLRNNNIELVF